MSEAKQSGKAPGGGKRRGGVPREAVLLGSYLGNLYFALAVLLWLAVLKAPLAALLIAPAAYAALRISVEGLPLKNPYDLKSLDRAARAAKMEKPARFLLAALAFTAASLFLLAYHAAPTAGAKLVATLAPLGIAALYGAATLIVGNLAARIDALERAARDKPFSYGPRVLPDGRPINLVHNPSETVH